MAKKQFYGIHYPFTANSEFNTLGDMNETIKDKVRSIIMHIIFTPKGQKLRDPEFGSDLIKYIFDPQDQLSMESIKSDVSEMINKYVGKNVNLDNIEIAQDENNQHKIFVKVTYTVKEGYTETKDSFAVTL